MANGPDGRWKCVGASVCGTSHVGNGLPCQDFCSWRSVVIGEERATLLAIADGAGSATRSDEGSQLTVETILQAIERHAGPLNEIESEHAERWLESARQRLQQQADAQGGKLADYAATVLVAILGARRSVFMHIGDGGWVVESANGFEAATWPVSGEYANQTIFITSPDGIAQMQFVVFDEPLQAVAGFTDGVQGLCLDLAARGPHAPFFQRMMAPLRSCDDEASLQVPLAALLDSSLFNNRTDDDKTLVMACFVPATGPSPAVPASQG